MNRQRCQVCNSQEWSPSDFCSVHDYDHDDNGFEEFQSTSHPWISNGATGVSRDDVALQAAGYPAGGEAWTGVDAFWSHRDVVIPEGYRRESRERSIKFRVGAESHFEDYESRPSIFVDWGRVLVGVWAGERLTELSSVYSGMASIPHERGEFGGYLVSAKDARVAVRMMNAEVENHLAEIEAPGIEGDLLRYEYDIVPEGVMIMDYWCRPQIAPCGDGNPTEGIEVEWEDKDSGLIYLTHLDFLYDKTYRARTWDVSEENAVVDAGGELDSREVVDFREVIRRVTQL